MRNEFIRSIRLKKADPKVVERFLSFFEELEDDECWLWGGKNLPYAGRFYFRRNPDEFTSAPRVQWELCVGPIDSKAVISLECGHPRCMNSLHMRVRGRGFNYTALEANRIGQRWIKNPRIRGEFGKA